MTCRRSHQVNLGKARSGKHLRECEILSRDIYHDNMTKTKPLMQELVDYRTVGLKLFGVAAADYQQFPFRSLRS